ncbi:MAG: flagellar motor switch protein FliN [Clostridia bacterium]|nr:flagellar motor switch protein FliN [Clostridia bacterium]
MDNSFLSQEEIDALLAQNDDISGLEDKDNDSLESHSKFEKEGLLTPEEQDALGEIGNISAGSASTALSDILGQKVWINTPKVWITTLKELYESFEASYVVIEVNYTSGVEGTNLLIMKQTDAAIIADLMMGGDGQNVNSELDEIKLSAVSEAMNQMVGSAATSLSTIFNKKVEISPPTATLMDHEKDDFYTIGDDEEDIVVISLNLQIGKLLKSDIMQVIPVDIAKQEIQLLMSGSGGTAGDDEEVSAVESSSGSIQSHQEKVYPSDVGQISQPSTEEITDYPSNKNLDLILDIPLKVSVLLGKTKKPINEILSLNLGSIVELQRLADEPVDILVNGTLIAKGEVVVVNENFGVKITEIVSRERRIKNLGEAK